MTETIVLSDQGLLVDKDERKTAPGFEIKHSLSETGRFVIQTLIQKDGSHLSLGYETSKYRNFEDSREAFWYTYLRKKEAPPINKTGVTIKIADLYAGCGGLSLGAREACTVIGKQFQSTLAIEKELEPMRVYQDNFDCKYPIFSDITEIIDSDLGEEPSESEVNFMNKIGKIDFMVAGPPCQGFSNLNNHTRRDDERNNLYLRVARFVELFKPDHLIIENVSQVKLDKKGFVNKTNEILDSLNYYHDEGAIDLSLVGVPQKRKRHVIVASRKKEVIISAVISKYKLETPRSAMWGIDDLQNVDNDLLIDRPANCSKMNKLRINYLHSMDEYKLPFALRPKCHRNNDHSYPSMYGRMYPDIPAQTITGGFYSPGQGRFIHPTRERTITAHEAARLQFFPDFFDFSQAITKKGISKMIGNAAPMLLSYYLSLELLN